MNYTYNEQTDTVSYELFNNETVTVDFKTFWIRQLVMDHMHYNGKFKNMVNGQQWLEAYLLCDGFGKGIDPLMAASQSYDWSHVRDSSDETLLEVAQYLATAVNWFGGDLEAMYQQHRNDVNRIKINNSEIDMLLGVV